MHLDLFEVTSGTWVLHSLSLKVHCLDVCYHGRLAAPSLEPTLEDLNFGGNGIDREGE